MKLSSKRFSLHQFQYFLKLIGKEGLVYGATLDQWREAARELEPFFSRDEKMDLRCVNIKQLSLGYVSAVVDKRASITPWRILTLEKSMAAALGEFIAFSVNPIRYRENTRLPKTGFQKAVA